MTPDVTTFRLRLFLEGGSGICLWADNEATKDRFGYGVASTALPVSDLLKARIEQLIWRYEAACAGVARDPAEDLGPTLFGPEPQAAAFAVEISVLARDLGEALGPDFAVVHGFTPAAPLAVGWNRRWTARAAVGAVAMSCVSLWFSWAIAFDGLGALSPGGRWILAAMFAAFALLFVGAAITYARASFDRSPVVVIGPEGIHDRRLSREPSPWSLISSGMPVQHGGQLMLVLNLNVSRWPVLPDNLLWRVNQLSARLTGAPALAVKMTGLDASLADILTAVQTQSALAAPAVSRPDADPAMSPGRTENALSS